MTRYAFGLIWDRWQLSQKHKDKFSDRYGVYCVYSRKELAGEMGVSLPTVRKCIDQLRDRDLIIMRMMDLGESWRYYIPDRIELYMADPEGYWMLP